MPTKTAEIDFSKPIRRIDGLPANYIGHDRNGNPVIETQFTNGSWGQACTWTPNSIKHIFENTPVERPKLEGFLEVYSNNHSWDCCIEVVHEEKPDQEASDVDGLDYWLTIDLAKVPDDAIVKVAP